MIPSKPEHAGKWMQTNIGMEPFESTLFWDDRGFLCVYIDGVRQLPVYMLPKDTKWKRVKKRRFVRTFKPQFSPLVKAGTKRQTVRKMPVRMPKPGDLISLREWTGRPYNSPQRILRESVITKVEKITFFPTNDYMQIGCKYLSPEEAELFARYDGFDSRKSMLDWFKKTHGHEMFEGIVIYWE